MGEREVIGCGWLIGCGWMIERLMNVGTTGG